MPWTIDLLPTCTEPPTETDADILFADTGTQEPNPSEWMRCLPDFNFHAGVDCPGGGLLQGIRREHRTCCHQAMQPSHRQDAPLYWPWVDLFTMGLKCLICRLPLGNDPITRNHRDAWLRQLRHWSIEEAADGSALLLFAFIVPAQDASDDACDLAIEGFQSYWMGSDILVWHNRGSIRLDVEQKRCRFDDEMGRQR